MTILGTILLVSWLAGLASYFGGLIAALDHSRESMLKEEVIHGVVAFGGGILVAAVAFALTPEGMKTLSPTVLGLVFCAGGLCFCLLDARISAAGGPKSQFLAMLLDFVPEAISMGAVFSTNPRLGILLAAFIGAQNLPEGFNAYREVVSSGARRRTTLMVLFMVSLLGPIASLLGYLLLQSYPQLTAGIMAFAGGGILYLIFQDIAPQSKLAAHWSPPLFAVLGFTVGMLGKQILQ